MIDFSEYFNELIYNVIDVLDIFDVYKEEDFLLTEDFKDYYNLTDE